MTTKERTAEYREPKEPDLEYVEKDLEGELENREEHPNSNYEAMNQHMVKFSDELKGLNEKFALDFDQRKNPADYELSERKEMLESVKDAFNGTDWNSADERRAAADDISETMFQPMYRRVELAEAASQYKLSDEFIEEIKKNQVEEMRAIRLDGGQEAMMFTVADIETAERLAAQSGGAFRVANTREMNQYRDQFADALYESDKDPGAMERMEQALEGAIDHYGGKLPQDRRDGEGAEYRTETKEGQTEHEAEEKTQEEMEETEADRALFWGMESLEEEVLEHQVREIVHEKLSHLAEYADELRTRGSGDAAAAAEIHKAAYQMYHRDLMEAVEKGDEEEFLKVAGRAKSESLELVESLRENSGFIDNWDYRQPGLPESFSSVQEVKDYINEVDRLSREYENDMNDQAYNMVTEFLRQMDERLEAIESTAGTSPDAEGTEESFRELRQMAGGMDHLMRTEDPVYWELHGLEEKERLNRLEDMTDLYIERAIESTEDERKEDVRLVLGLVRERMAQQMEREGNYEERLVEERGEHPANAFRMTHNGILEEMKSIEGYADTIAEGTSDLTAREGIRAKPLLEEFTPSGNEEEYDAEVDRYLYEAAKIAPNYDQLDAHLRENNDIIGSEENLQLMEHMSRRFRKIMDEMLSSEGRPESFEERAQEAAQLSRIMVGMVKYHEEEE